MKQKELSYHFYASFAPICAQLLDDQQVSGAANIMFIIMDAMADQVARISEVIYQMSSGVLAGRNIYIGPPYSVETLTCFILERDVIIFRVFS